MTSSSIPKHDSKASSSLKTRPNHNSLSSIVSHLVRSQIGVTAAQKSVSNNDLDEHVARILLEEAKEKNKAWDAGKSYSNLEGTSKTSVIRKPNKRFLNAIVRNADEHNAALLRQEAEAAYSRERKERKLAEDWRRGRGESHRHGGKSSEDKGKATEHRRRSGEEGYREVDLLCQSTRREDYHRSEEGGEADSEPVLIEKNNSGRKRDRGRDESSRGRKEEAGEGRLKERRRRSSSPHTESQNRFIPRIYDRSHDAINLGRPSDEKAAPTSNAPPSTGIGKPAQLSTSLPSICKEEAGKDAEASNPNRTKTESSSKMDRYFSSDYDPRLDVQVADLTDPATGIIADSSAFDGWNTMLKVIQDRKESKKINEWNEKLERKAERDRIRKERDETKSSNKRRRKHDRDVEESSKRDVDLEFRSPKVESPHSRSSTLMSIKGYASKSGVREWDRGKDMST